MSAARAAEFLRLAAVLALAGLVLMAWSMLDPRPGPVLVALSIGQFLGGTSLLLFFAVIVAEARRTAPREADQEAPGEGEPPA